MANDMTFTIKADNIKQILAEKDKLVEDALIICGEKMEGYAKGQCPVATGRLRGSITYATTTFHSSSESPAKGDDSTLHGTPEKGSVYIGTNVEYAPYQEYGSNGRVGHHYLKKGVQDHLSEYQNVIDKTLRD